MLLVEQTSHTNTPHMHISCVPACCLAAAWAAPAKAGLQADPDGRPRAWHAYYASGGTC